jgi:hypothetical protein
VQKALTQINAQLANVISEQVQLKMTTIGGFHFSHEGVPPLRVGSPKESTPFFPLKIGTYKKNLRYPWRGVPSRARINVLGRESSTVEKESHENLLLDSDRKFPRNWNGV